MIKKLFAVFGLIWFALITCQVQATPVTWYLDGVTFQDHSTATGGWTYDADLGLYSDVVVTVSGSFFLSTSFTTADIYGADGNEIEFFREESGGAIGRGLLIGWLGSGLTNAGGIYDLATAPGLYATWYLNGSRFESTDVTQGRVVSVSPVPEPEIYAMLGVGLGLMGWVGRHREQQAA